MYDVLGLILCCISPLLSLSLSLSLSLPLSLSLFSPSLSLSLSSLLLWIPTCLFGSWLSLIGSSVMTPQPTPIHTPHNPRWSSEPLWQTPTPWPLRVFQH